MKFAVFSLLCLFCVQTLNGASISERSELNKSSNDIAVYNDDSQVAVYDTRINLPSCFTATKNIFSLSVSAWNLFNKHSAILNKAKEEKNRCSKLPTPEEVIQCDKTAEETKEKELADFMKDVWNLVPVMATTFVEIIKCLM